MQSQNNKQLYIMLAGSEKGYPPAGLPAAKSYAGARLGDANTTSHCQTDKICKLPNLVKMNVALAKQRLKPIREDTFELSLHCRL
jgi:hypothetical protein